MAIPRKQIGWSQESNLLWEISRQMEKLTGVAFNGGGGGSALTIKDDGTTLTTGATSIDFTGAGVTASATGTAVTVNIPGGGSGTTLITVTKSALDTLISGNDLIPGQYYKVLGVDLDLYGGTDIIIQAETENKLALQGHGIFYTPKYNQEVQGFNIWSKNITYTCSSFELPIPTGEIVELRDPENNILGTAIFRNENLLEWISGSTADWTSSGNFIYSVDSNYHGYDFNATNFPSSINPNLGDLTIWGGIVWSNDSSETGISLDQFTLDSNWNVVPFNTTDYNISIDVIHYDYEHNLIIYRKDKYGNEVSFDYTTLDEQTNPIKVFQWGNGYSLTYARGVSECRVLDGSAFDCINFRGLCLRYITLEESSSIYGLTFEYDSSMQCVKLVKSTLSTMICVNSTIVYINLNFTSNITNINICNNSIFSNLNISINSSIYNIVGNEFTLSNNSISNNSSINNITSWDGAISFNVVDQNSYISTNYSTFNYPVNIVYNTLSNESTFEGNDFVGGGYINSNVLSKSSHIDSNVVDVDSSIYNNILVNNGNISSNTLNSSNINNNNISLGSINNTTFTAGSFSQSNIFATDFIFTLAPGQNLSKINASNAGSINYNLTTGATLIFNASTDKNIFLNSAGIVRMSYYDALDTLQIVNVNA